MKIKVIEMKFAYKIYSLAIEIEVYMIKQNIQIFALRHVNIWEYGTERVAVDNVNDEIECESKIYRKKSEEETE